MWPSNVHVGSLRFFVRVCGAVSLPPCVHPCLYFRHLLLSRLGELHPRVRGTVESIATRGCSRPRSALRFQTPPLQRRTHRTPGCAPLKRRRHSPARSTCADVLSLRSSPLGAGMVSKSRNMSAGMLFMPGLLALMTPTICCVRSQSVRDLVTEIAGGARRQRCGVLRAPALSSRGRL